MKNKNYDNALTKLYENLEPIEKEVGDGWDNKTVKQGNLELDNIGKQLYQLFKKEGAKVALDSTQGAIGDKDFQVYIDTKSGELSIDMNNAPAGMLTKYGPMILKSFPNLELGNKSDIKAIFRLKTNENLEPIVAATKKQPGEEGFLPIDAANEIIADLREIVKKSKSDDYEFMMSEEIKRIKQLMK